MPRLSTIHPMLTKAPTAPPAPVPAAPAAAAPVQPGEGPRSLLKVPEVAKRLRVRDRRVNQLIAEGLLPAVHLGRQIRVDPDILEAWIRNGGRPLADDGAQQAG
jgi:excisionase family DNA binding protein